MRSTLSLRSFPNVAFEAVPMCVNVHPTDDVSLSCSFKEDHLALPLSTPLFSRQSKMVKAVTQINILPNAYYLKLNHNVFKIRMELVAVFVGHFGFLFTVLCPQADSLCSCCM